MNLCIAKQCGMFERMMVRERRISHLSVSRLTVLEQRLVKSTDPIILKTHTTISDLLFSELQSNDSHCSSFEPFVFILSDIVTPL